MTSEIVAGAEMAVCKALASHNFDPQTHLKKLDMTVSACDPGAEDTETGQPQGEPV